ncbi:Cupin 2 conserved barrel domain protein [Pararobbsia alpina]|uniref:cupin domain-containing protein n=1 Tax=Pararobbsia alpina TaxID=621374 RepID=UPI0039A5A65C
MRLFHFHREGRPHDRERETRNGAAIRKLEHFVLAPRSWVPNNARLPVMLYHQALPERDDLGTTFDALFEANGWPVQWHDSVFDYHHYHSTAHEVLGVISGEAEIILGGPNGRVIYVHPGDVLVLPAGTGHCRLSSTPAFRVVGAYPPGQKFDIRREAPTEADLVAIARLPFPDSDPVTGQVGELTKLWTRPS